MSAPTKRKTPARKPATSTETAPGDVVEVVPVPHMAYSVQDDVLHYTTKSGVELAIDLDFPPELIKMSMGTDDEDRSDEEQFEIIRRTYGDNFQDAYERMGMLERRRLQRAVFTEFQKAMLMPMGESSGSSRS